MYYQDLLKQLRECPFCPPYAHERPVHESRHAFLTYNAAPYHKHHLLVIPKKHHEHVLDATPIEQREMLELIDVGVKVLQVLGYQDMTILIREGQRSGKSVRHMHYHIVPKVLIGDVTHRGKKRKVLTKKQITALHAELDEAMKRI